MSILKSLFGSGTSGSAGAPAAVTEHNGFTIEAVPYQEAGQWQLAGAVYKEIDGTRKEYRFVRADRFADRHEAAARALDKGRQLIDEQGEQLFG